MPIGGLLVWGLNSLAISLPSFQVPASKTLGKVSYVISFLKKWAVRSRRQMVSARHSTTTSLSTWKGWELSTSGFSFRTPKSRNKPPFLYSGSPVIPSFPSNLKSPTLLQLADLFKRFDQTVSQPLTQLVERHDILNQTRLPGVPQCHSLQLRPSFRPQFPESINYAFPKSTQLYHIFLGVFVR